MKTLGVIAIAMSSLCSNAVFADSIVTYTESILAKGKPATYLSVSGTDNAYVYVTAQVSNPEGFQCVEPAGTDSIGSLFIRSNTDLAITVQPQGFFGIDPKKEIPIASYAFVNEGKYCKSSWRQSVVVVPPTPFGLVTPGSVGASDPSLVVQFRSSAQPTLSILEPVQALLGVSGALATGGAATTVVGLAKMANGPAVEFLSKEFENRRKTEADGTYIFAFSWGEIASGLRQKRLELINGKRRMFETASTAIQRVKAAPRAADNAKILDISFFINTRRSVFVTDAELSNDLPVVSAALASNAILNFPRIAGVPNIYQRINAEAPSTTEDLRNNKAGVCDAMLVTIKELGFNKLDRALIMGAILDHADGGSEKWRGEPNKYLDCFKFEPSIPATLTSVYGSKYFPVAPPIIVFVDVEAFINPPPAWPAAIENYLTKLRMALFSSGENRIASLGFSDAIKNIPANAVYGASDIAFVEDFQLGTAKLADVFRSMPIDQVGCIFGVKVAADNTWRGAMIVTTKLKSGGVEPYLMEVTFNADGSPTPTYATLIPILSPVGASYAAIFENARFRPKSMCARQAGIDGDSVLRSLRKSGKI